MPKGRANLATPKGRTGTIHQGGEINRRWDLFRSVDRWVDEADEMLLHPCVYDAWQQRQAQMTAAKFVVRSAKKGDPLADAYAEFVRQALGLEGEPGMCQRPFEAVFKQFSKAQFYGFAVGEDLYYYARGRIWLRDIESRGQRTISSWGPVPGVLGPIEQRIEGMTSTLPRPMPAHQVILVTRDRDDTDWQGRGLARAARAAWKRMCFAEDARAAGIERGVYRPPEVDVSEDVFSGGADPSARQVYDEMVQAAAGYTAGKDASVFKRVRSSDDRVLVGVNWLSDDGWDPQKVIAAEQRDEALVYKAFGLGWLMMGQDGNSGSRALGQVHEGMLRLIAINDTEETIAAFNGPDRAGGGLVGRLIKHNFANAREDLLPTIWHDGLEVDRLMELLPHLAALSQAGWLTPRNAAEDAIWRGVDVPPLDDTERRSPAERIPGMQAAFTAMRAEISRHKRVRRDAGIAPLVAEVQP